jgi:hypothetical protein
VNDDDIACKVKGAEITSLKMATWVVEACWWPLCNKSTSIIPKCICCLLIYFSRLINERNMEHVKPNPFVYLHVVFAKQTRLHSLWKLSSLYWYILSWQRDWHRANWNLCEKGLRKSSKYLTSETWKVIYTRIILKITICLETLLSSKSVARGRHVTCDTVLCCPRRHLRWENVF